MERVARLGEESLHRLKGGLAQLEAVVDRVLERAEVDLVDELGALRRLVVEQRQQRRQQRLHGARLVVREAVEREQCVAPHLEVRVLEGGEEGKDGVALQALQGQGVRGQADAPVAGKWICKACSMIYDPAEGDPDSGIAAGTPFESIPDDWQCPICGARKASFVPYREAELKSA